MDKNKIIKLYNDFAEGKLLSSSDRINFEDRFKHLKKWLDFSPASFAFENNQDNYQDCDINYFNGLIHPVLALKLTVVYDNLSKEDYRPIYPVLINVLNHTPYYQAYTKNLPNNDDIYVVSDNMFDYFSNVEIPDDITFQDLKFTRNLPSLFIFEKNSTLVYLNNYLFPNSDKPQLMACIFNMDKNNPYFPLTFILNSNDDKFYKDKKINQYIKEKSNLPEIFKNQYLVLYNLLLFLANKDTLDYKSDELNKNIFTALENIQKGVNIKRNENLLKELPSYRFIDLELTLANYSKEYHKKNPNSEQHSKTPHWRSAHWHTYWKGKRDGKEERRKDLKFIPMTWIGSPELKTDILSFKIIK